MGKRTYAVVGLGAVGGLYGGRLQGAGHDVHFLVRSQADEIREHGLDLRSVYGDVRLPTVSVFTDVVDVPPVDAVVVAIKTTANASLAASLPRLTDGGAPVLVLQNGLGVEAEVAASSGDAPVVGGLAFVCSNRLGPGRIHHLDYGSVGLAEYRADGAAAGVTAAVQAFADDLGDAGVAVRALTDLALARWRKLVWNIPFNGLSVVLDANTDEIVADGDTRALSADLMREVVAGAAACGVSIDDSFVDSMLADTEEMEPYRTSMKVDFDERRPLELEAIYRRPIETARAAGYEMARADALSRELSFLDERNRAEDRLGPPGV